MTTARTHFVALAVALAAASSSPRPLLAQKVLAEGVEDLAAQIAASIAKEQKTKVAVLPFRALDGQQTMLGMFLAEELVTNLFVRGLDIVERTMLDRVLGEIKLGQSGVIDPETARQVGKVAGVDAVVSGTITDLSSYVALNCRLIDAQTGRVFAAAQVKIAKDDDLKKILGTALPAPAAHETVNTPTIAAKIPGKASQRKEIGGFVFELTACRATGDSVQCDFLITSSGIDKQLRITSSGFSRLIDDAGNEYLSQPEGAFLGSAATNFFGNLESNLVSGVPVRARLVFKGGAEGAALASVVELSAASENSRFQVQFRAVPLAR